MAFRWKWSATKLLADLERWVARWKSPKILVGLAVFASPLFFALLIHSAVLKQEVVNTHRDELRIRVEAKEALTIGDWQAPNTQSLDQRRQGYSPAEAASWFKSIGSRRFGYGLSQIFLDTPLAGLYATLMLFWLIHCGEGSFERRPALRWFLVAPICAGVFDILENLSTASLAFLENDSVWLAKAASLATVTKWLCLGIVLLAMLTLGRHTLKALVHGLVLMRVPLTMAAILILLPVLAVSGPAAVRSVVYGLGGWGLFGSALLTTLTAGLVAHTGVLIWERAPVRFHAEEFWVLRAGPLRVLLQSWLVASLAVPLVALMSTTKAEGSSAWPGIAGLVVAGLILIAIVWLHAILRPRLVGWLQRLRRVPTPSSNTIRALLGPGYSSESLQGDARWRLGHLYSTLLLFTLLFIYAVVGTLGDPGNDFHLPALVFILLLVMVLGSLLSGLTFFLDRYRVPLSLALFVWLALVGVLRPRPHTVLVAEPAPRQTGEGRNSSDLDWLLLGTDPVDAAAKRLQQATQGSNRPVLTVVTAAGGGIQASAWTTRVLTGLQKSIGNEFTRSIHLISAVSGGSTGSYLFAESFNSDLGAPPDDLLEKIFDTSMEPSLAEAGWGLAFADVLRSFVPFTISDKELHRDRGWAMEQAWREDALELKRAAECGDRCSAQQSAAIKGSSLAQWAQKAENGSLPGIILNSTIVDDGQQALFSNLNLCRLQEVQRQPFKGRSQKVSDPSLRRHFPDPGSINTRKTNCPNSSDGRGLPNLDASTAARLSATFPWVSPVARIDLHPDDKLSGPGYHFADGGYFDNFGTMAAIQWLRLLAHDNRAPLSSYDAILFIEINAFPQRPDLPPDTRRSGLLYSFLGPLKTMLEVQTSSQLSRGLLELDLVRNEITHILAENALATGSQSPTLHFFEFRPPETYLHDPPLSWKLSGPEQTALTEAWNANATQDQVCRVDALFSGSQGTLNCDNRIPATG